MPADVKTPPLSPLDREDLIAAETELECISDVATGARPASDFQPADPETVLGQVLHALAAAWRAGHLAGQRAGLDAVVNLCGDWCAEEGCPCEPASIARAIRRLPLADPPPAPDAPIRCAECNGTEHERLYPGCSGVIHPPPPAPDSTKEEK